MTRRAPAVPKEKPITPTPVSVEVQDAVQENQLKQYHELKRLALTVARGNGSDPMDENAFAAAIVLEAMGVTDFEVARRAHGILGAWLTWSLDQSGELPEKDVALLNALQCYIEDFGGWTREDRKWCQVGQRPGVLPPLEPAGEDLPWRDPGYEHYVVTCTSEEG